MASSTNVVTAKAGHKEKGVEPTMKTYVLKKLGIATDQEVFVGLDVAATDIAVCVLGADLTILCREKIPHTEHAVAAFLARLPGCTVHAAYEAGPTGYHLLRWLRAHRCDAAMVAPSRIPVESGDRVKTDKRDALKIATLLATNQLRDRFVNDLTDSQYADRQLVRCRAQAVRRCSSIQTQIKALMLMHHIKLPEDMKPNFSESMRDWLAAYDTGHPYLNEALREQLLWLEQTKTAVQRLNGHCRKLAKEPRHKDGVKLLCSIPGVGVITAMVLLTELPDLTKRFPDGAALVRYAGLVPTEHSTGKSQGRRGGLTHDGNAHVRTALIEASWRLIRGDPEAAARYFELADRRGSQKAIAAVARHLGMVIYAMFCTQKEYGCHKEVSTPRAA